MDTNGEELQIKVVFSSLCQGLPKDLRDRDAFLLIAFIMIAIVINIIIITITIIVIIIIILYYYYYYYYYYYCFSFNFGQSTYKSNLKSQTVQLGLFAPN